MEKKTAVRSLDVSPERLSTVLDVLVGAGHLLTTCSDLPESLAQIAELCAGKLCDYCSVHIVVEALERTEFSASAGIHPEQPVGILGKIVEPLAAGRRMFGSLTCVTSEEGGFDDAVRRGINLLALELAMVIAGHASALREHRVADRFARVLLPHVHPVVPGVELHAAYRPASEEAEVGGDWYDAFSLGEGRIAISVGDVAGHGLDAAVIMGEVRQAIRTAAVGTAAPAEVLEYVNGVIRLRESISMVTALFGVYDSVRSVLSYAVAGHPPPILALPGGVTRRLPTGGLPLGCASTIESQEWTFSVPMGARAVFYTDGLIENERNLIAGEEALLAVVRDLSLKPFDDPAVAIQERVFAGASNRDDAAVFVLTRTAPVPHYVFPALPLASPIARAIVEQAIRPLQLSNDRQFGVLVAVGEAIANAVEHAYRGSPPGLIRMEIAIDSLALVVTVEDYGRWRPFVRREERGRGIELMHAFMDGVQIRSTRESTAIVLKVRLDLA